MTLVDDNGRIRLFFKDLSFCRLDGGRGCLGKGIAAERIGIVGDDGGIDVVFVVELEAITTAGGGVDIVVALVEKTTAGVKTGSVELFTAGIIDDCCW